MMGCLSSVYVYIQIHITKNNTLQILLLLLFILGEKFSIEVLLYFPQKDTYI